MLGQSLLCPQCCCGCKCMHAGFVMLIEMGGTPHEAQYLPHEAQYLPLLHWFVECNAVCVSPCGVVTGPLVDGCIGVVPIG
jgi:hypothetical protein